MDFLDQLNPQQRNAVTAGEGPVLVLAGPGSGKTRVLTQRIAYLIGYEGVRPYQMLAVTFTNKAAREMEHRVQKLLGEEMTRGLLLGTFHSTCARILRRESERLPVNSEFVIFDADDQQTLVKNAIKELNLNDKQYRPVAIHGAISRAKNELIGPDDFPIQNYRDEVVKRIYKRYQELLQQSNAVDFDDMLLMTANLLEEHPDVRDKYAQRFHHVLVDEFQDTNQAQYMLVKHLSSIHNNIFVVGDPDQCFPPGTLIKTPGGEKPIDSLQVGDTVIAASGGGATLESRVNHVGKRPFHGELVKVVTNSGHTFSASPNHIVFARLGADPGLHYVYLLYHKDQGYHIGAASRDLKTNLLKDAEKVWVLKVCLTYNEAHYWVSFFSFDYSIPAIVSQVRGEKPHKSQAQVDQVFGKMDTAANAISLLAFLKMEERYPHYISQAAFHNAVHLHYFGDEHKTGCMHRVDLWGSDPTLADKLRAQGYNLRMGNGSNWQVGLNRLQYDEAQETAQKLSLDAGVPSGEIVVSASLTDCGDARSTPDFNLMPAGQLHRSMIVAIEKDGKIIEDEIVEIGSQPYNGDVYDFEVDQLHNYLADGIVVHNSVYRWRGADYRNVQRFEQDFPGAQTILLEQNYRSKQTILDAAMAVIDRNPRRKRKQLFTERGGGEKIAYYEAGDDYGESSFVVDTIAQLVASKQFEPGDCAVMYRTNAMSRLLEEAFLSARLPYRLVGAQRFYGRREVKDMIAFLRLVYNPADEVSLDRVVNIPPRGIGDKTILALHSTARAADTTPGAVLLDLARGSDSPYFGSFSGRAALPLADFGGLFSAWRGLVSTYTVAELFDRIAADINYIDHVNDGTEEGKERWENVLELRRLASDYSTRTLAEFLENVALISDQDTLVEGNNVPTLLTLHAAKGLEFGVVFIVGLDDGILPHSRSFDEPEEMEEERRLFYVGITRAKDRLYLLRAERRGGRGYAEETIPSRFLEDVPAALLSGKSRTGRSDRRSSSSNSTWTLPSPSRPAPIIQHQYRAGSRIQHPTWGDGIVLDSRVQDNDEIVDVVFESVGIKRLAASLAKLTIIK